MTKTQSKKISGADDKPPISGADDKPPMDKTEIIGKELMDQADKVETQVNQGVEKKVEQTDFRRIIDDVSENYKCPPATALIGTFSTLQAGGTNKNKRSNVKININTILFESKVINNIICKHCKDFTPRQFAVHFRNEIYHISKRHNITGNAYVSLRRHYSHLLTEVSPEEKFWASDFQLENPDCPDYIRTALLKRYNDKFIKK
jgi:hypothetical protein